MSPIRIVYHHRTRAEDAQGVHIGAMVRAFRDLGHEVTVVSPLATAAEPTAAGRNEPALSSRRFGIPLFLEVNSPLRREQAQLGRLAFGRLAQATERWVCSNAAATTVVSGVTRDILRADGVAEERLLVMPNGVDPRQFRPEVSGAEVRRELGLGEGVVVGFVGWFRPWHGLEGLLETMFEAGHFARGVRLLLVGEGPARPALDAFVARHGLDGRVILGVVEPARIPEYVAAMDVAVQPDASEYACPMKLIEYVAMGRCIVAPRQANICELVEDGSSAALFDRDTPGSLRAALDLVLGDPAWRRDLGAAAAVVAARGARERGAGDGPLPARPRRSAERQLGGVLRGKGLNRW